MGGSRPETWGRSLSKDRCMLSDDTTTPPSQFDILFKKKLKGDNRGMAGGQTIYLNASYFFRNTNNASSYTKNPTNFDSVLIHEMAHIAQHNGFRSYWNGSPSYWAEGLSDYARYKLGYTNGWRCPECGTDYPHYTSGYRCAGAFLLYVDGMSGSNVGRRLASALRHGSYTDHFLAKETGKDLKELWAEFQKTAAFLPNATEMYQIHQALGYVNGRPPKNLSARAVAYLKKRPGGPLTLDAGNFVHQLAEQNKLPGVTEAERKRKSFALSVDPADFLRETESKKLPTTRKLIGSYDQGETKYYYAVFRASEEKPWVLQRAWRAGADGQILEEYQVE